MLVALAVGAWTGRRRSPRGPTVFEGGALVLTAILLGLTWSSSCHTYFQRLALVHEECDGLGEVYRMVTLLSDDDRRWMHSHMLAYVDSKLRYLQEGGAGIQKAQPEPFRLQGEMMDHLGKLPDNTARQDCLMALNHAVQLHYRRQYSYRERLPGVVMDTLGLCCVCCAFLAGWSRPEGGRAAWLAPVLLVLLLGGAFYSLETLDDPVRGVTIDYANLHDLRNIFVQAPE